MSNRDLDGMDVHELMELCESLKDERDEAIEREQECNRNYKQDMDEAIKRAELAEAKCAEMTKDAVRELDDGTIVCKLCGYRAQIDEPTNHYGTCTLAGVNPGQRLLDRLRRAEALITEFRRRSATYETEAHEEYNFEDGKKIAFASCAEQIEQALACEKEKP